MSRVFVDVRTLQDPSYAPRGIGRHGLNIVRHAPRSLSLIGLYDPALPAVSAEVRSRFDGMLPNAGGDVAADAFVQLSPLTHDPLFVARLLLAPEIPKLTAVYDFIPWRDPTLHLRDAAAHAAYAIRLRWLAEFDRFCPISVAVGQELQNLLGVPPRAIHVTGAPVSEVFARHVARPVVEGRPPYLALLGGPDARKNPEVAIIAHAQSARLQAARVTLCIAGNYSPAESSQFQALSAKHGGDSALVMVPGHLPDDDLAALLAGAHALICSSLDEGFSLPVVEGAALGVPALVSDILVHRELIANPADRFIASDHQSLAAAAERLVFDPQWRTEAIKRQSSISQRFTGDKVARRFWSALEEPLERRATIPAPRIKRSRPRVALVSPVAPARTGVADHSAALARELGPMVDLDIFSPTPSPWPVTGARGVYPLSAFPHLATDFDRVINVMGNSAFHLPIFRLLSRFGGACIAHDARMLGFYRVLLGEAHAINVSSRELGRPVTAAELRRWLADEGIAEAQLLGEIATSSSHLIVHSKTTAALVEARHQVTAAHIPFCIQRQPSAATLTPTGRAAARVRLGIAEQEIVVATFGHVNASKAPQEGVWAIELLRSWGIPVTLHFVGAAKGMHDGGAGLRGLITRLGLDEHVRLAPDHISEAQYQDYLVGSDVALQLRTYDLGQISGALSDCIGAGLPAVATQGLAESIEAPRELVVPVPNDLSPLLIAEALLELIDSDLRSERRAAVRLAFCDEHSASRYAARLCRALELGVA
jgi:glycosyltransferase involved in cell wall biosynthesis